MSQNHCRLTFLLHAFLLIALVGACQIDNDDTEFSKTELSMSAECIDSDGDGWGWDGVSSCRVGDNDNGSTGGTTTGRGACIDDDGDGWGWDGVSSCRVGDNDNGSTGRTTTGGGACIDDDGDGWGWDGVSSCRVGDNDNGSTGGTTTGGGACIDDDGDGWGWDGVSSCRVGDNDNGSTGGTTTGGGSYTINDVTDVILMAGQSNALGEQTQYDSNLDAPHPRVFVWTQNNGWQNANLRTQIWRKNYFPSADGRGSNHPGFQIAKSIARRDSNRVVAFIPTGVAGQAISHWFGGYWNTLRSNISNAMGALPNNSKIDMIWWMQGETDWQPTDAYRSSLYSLINDQFRRQSWFDTGLFIANETYRAPINSIFRELNSDSDPYTFFSAAEGLSVRDSAHFDTAALRIIGQRVANVYLSNSP